MELTGIQDSNLHGLQKHQPHEKTERTGTLGSKVKQQRYYITFKLKKAHKPTNQTQNTKHNNPELLQRAS